MYKISLLLLVLLLTACDKEIPIEIPSAQKLTREANGYYCLMTVVFHKGPKGQIILSDDKVLWFTSVRDTIAFTMSPEEPKNIAAIYVNDMSNAEWDNPGAENWINARDAWYVLGSSKVGGMDAPETVPFATKVAAETFANKEGGSVHTFSTIPKNYIIDTSDK